MHFTSLYSTNNEHILIKTGGIKSKFEIYSLIISCVSWILLNTDFHY